MGEPPLTPIDEPWVDDPKVLPQVYMTIIMAVLSPFLIVIGIGFMTALVGIANGQEGWKAYRNNPRHYTRASYHLLMAGFIINVLILMLGFIGICAFILLQI